MCCGRQRNERGWSRVTSRHAARRKRSHRPRIDKSGLDAAPRHDLASQPPPAASNRARLSGQKLPCAGQRLPGGEDSALFGTRSLAPTGRSASVAVLRTFLTMVGLSVFWLASGWPYGSVAMLLATVFAGIMATVPNPVGAVLNAVISQGVGMLAAFVVTFWILPRCDGFPMLIMATLPFFLVGLYLQTRVGKLASFGLGYTVGLAFTVVLGNPMVYAPEVFVNTVIAQLFGYGFSGAMFLVIPSLVGTAWQRRRQLRQLRQQVVRAATEPLSGDLMHSFESISRDLFEQVVAHTKPDSRDSRDLLAWALSVHDSGRALIELRQVLAANPVPATVAAVTRQAVQDVARLYANPDATRWQQADQAMSAAIAAAAAAQTEAHVGIRRVLLRLYQLRSGLRDDESALAAYQNTPEPARAT
ncbi:p-hydroxybenzoic acid efflux pump subunit AaeB [Rhodanobacter lindaniclasticus]